MSTIVVVKKNGKAVIAADTLSKYGSMKQDKNLIVNGSKIIKFGDNYIAHVGDCAYSHILNSYMNKYSECPSLNNIQEIFEFACDFHKELKEQYYLRPDENEDDDFESLRFESLIINPQGIFGLYALRSVDEYNMFFSFGTGSRYALGAMKTVYDKDYTAEEIAVIGLESAEFFDDSTGKPFDVKTIDLI